MMPIQKQDFLDKVKVCEDCSKGPLPDGHRFSLYVFII